MRPEAWNWFCRHLMGACEMIELLLLRVVAHSPLPVLRYHHLWELGAVFLVDVFRIPNVRLQHLLLAIRVRVVALSIRGNLNRLPKSTRSHFLLLNLTSFGWLSEHADVLFLGVDWILRFHAVNLADLLFFHLGCWAALLKLGLENLFIFSVYEL